MRKLVPLVVDALLVILFCVIGRRSHDEAVLAGLLKTVWPFAIGLAIGWVAAVIVASRIFGAQELAARFDGTALWPTGVLVWLGTLCGGMLARVIGGQGTAFSFIVVATCVLALFLLGWRAAIKAIN
ncbi:DUF3054 domain-containing protein [Nocardia sp. NBC_00565]|uniref:DUF3054 domain-containing protein n=1 Tax=Nocardia sp. NBC_00565 TaxID=2975993 RepID=UPI002E811FF2|nr:DUF3054 domain-containing protein [Nocardia sp. NBC_00565]WUC02320.1 DUF3054 domain-containing protein [Nocardia sp. NBC_00565]